MVEKDDDMSDMSDIDSAWSFKFKRFTDELIKKFKSRIFACVDQQLKGVDFFVTYNPIVQWKNICLMLILEVLLGIKSNKGDVTTSFIHTDAEKGENVYVSMAMYFKHKGRNRKSNILKLKNNIYSIRQSPQDFCKYLTAKLEACGLAE